jgi:nicotinamide-nucleotide amidase
MVAEIISIGDELLIGQVVNTNAGWIGQQLHAIGLSIRQVTAIPDRGEDIKKAITEALSRSDVVMVTGGLGPTRDDITKKTLCEYFNDSLVLHEPSLELIRKTFAARSWNLTEANRKQAEIPSKCKPILNYNGTAPGMWFESDGRILVSMPGVPFEMEAMVLNYVIPNLLKIGKEVFVAHRTVQTHGVGESSLMDMIRHWEEALPENFKLAYLPQPGIVRLRLTATAGSRETAEAQVESQLASLKELIADLIFGYDNQTMEEVLGILLREKNATLSTAESCTGGYLAHLITSIPGSSDYFRGSVIAYANDVKMKQLGVSEESLSKHGAVSEQVVREMAEGARRTIETDYALATSGIAGPDGGTTEKPVGLVWIALATPEGTFTKRALYGEHRGRNIRRATLDALNLLRMHLIK